MLEEFRRQERRVGDDSDLVQRDQGTQDRGSNVIVGRARRREQGDERASDVIGSFVLKRFSNFLQIYVV
jgi:hypothetical protein